MGLLLGRLIETEMLRAWQLAGGDPWHVLEYPWALGIMGLMVLSLLLSLRRDLRRRAASG